MLDIHDAELHRLFNVKLGLFLLRFGADDVAVRIAERFPLLADVIRDEQSLRVIAVVR